MEKDMIEMYQKHAVLSITEGFLLYD